MIFDIQYCFNIYYLLAKEKKNENEKNETTTGTRKRKYPIVTLHQHTHPPPHTIILYSFKLKVNIKCNRGYKHFNVQHFYFITSYKNTDNNVLLLVYKMYFKNFSMILLLYTARDFSWYICEDNIPKNFFFYTTLKFCLL